MTQTFRLEAVQLQGVGVFDNTLIRFKPIECAERDEKLAEIHLFTGPNGCGKSTLLYALAEIFEFTNSLNSLIISRFRNAESQVDFCFDEQSGQYRTKISSIGSNQFGSFSQWVVNDPNKGKVFRYGNNFPNRLESYKRTIISFQPNNPHNQTIFAFAAFAYSGQRTLRSEPLVGIQEIANSPFESALSFENTSRPKVLLQWIANNRTKSALAKMDNNLQDAAGYDLALERITRLIYDVCDMDVEFRLERSPLAVTVRVNGDSIQFDGLPDGLKSIISWVADLSLRLEAILWEAEQDIFSQPIILFLDEVDIHLHPKWQRRILPAIQKLLPNAQIFVSTHSPFVVGSVENAWVYRLPEPGAKTDGILEIEGIPSGAGKSYRLILNEIFDIDKEFDVETEALFDDFYQARAMFLKTPTNADEMIKIAGLLAARGEEAAAIVARELVSVHPPLGARASRPLKWRPRWPRSQQKAGGSERLRELRQLSRVTGVEVSLA